MNWRVKYDHYKELQWNYEVFEMTTFILVMCLKEDKTNPQLMKLSVS